MKTRAEQSLEAWCAVATAYTLYFACACDPEGFLVCGAAIYVLAGLAKLVNVFGKRES